MPRNRTRRRSESNAAASTVTPTPPRSKAGCWTCRIRRKRCDETQDETGACLACKRLDIECLGWGTKRPEWCRDKEALNQYKLSLKRKLCSRAGTRPSAASTGALSGLEATRMIMPTIEPHHDVTRAPSGESPASSESAADEEPDTGKCAVSSQSPNDSPSPAFSTDDLTFNFTFSPSPHSTINQLPTSDSDFPLFSTHMHIPNLHHHRRAIPQPQPLSRIASQLLNILQRSTLPAEYASIASQLLDLHFFKSNSKSPNANVEHEAARRAQFIDAELSRLANRSAFDNLFAGTTGFAFDPSSFLAPTPSHSHPNTSPYAAAYSSPMTMWSPELVSDTMSTFSGSSAPTSPAVPQLAMSHTPMGDMLYDQYQQQQQQSMYDPYMSMHSLTSQPQQQQPFGSALGFGGLGALGLSSDFLFSEYPTSSHPAISLLPPTPTPAMSSKIAPSQQHLSSFPINTTTTNPAQAHDSDPLQIHYETCTLLLQAVLTTSASASTTSSTHFDFVNPSQSHELEECLQRLTTKFETLSLSSSDYLFGAHASLSPSSEYLFSATVAGAMSTSADRRAFFRRVVGAIEGRIGGGTECVSLLDEAWRE